MLDNFKNCSNFVSDGTQLGLRQLDYLFSFQTGSERVKVGAQGKSSIFLPSQICKVKSDFLLHVTLNTGQFEF